MAHMAVKTFPALDQNDPYDAGIAYNEGNRPAAQGAERRLAGSVDY